MITRKTVSMVSFWDVLDHIGFGDDEVGAISDYGLSNVSWGDASYTLIGNNFALDCIHAGNMHLDDPFNPELITMRYWEVVGQDDYVNMETFG